MTHRKEKKTVLVNLNSSIDLVNRLDLRVKNKLSYFRLHSGYIKVLDGNSTQVFSREGCLNNHTSSTFLEIAFQESQDITIRVSLNNKQSYVRLSYGILKDGLDAGKDQKQ